MAQVSPASENSRRHVISAVSEGFNCLNHWVPAKCMERFAMSRTGMEHTSECEQSMAPKVRQSIDVRRRPARASGALVAAA
ncbi:hypothetical protein M8818_003462 [Zalaria obscura]|uniref:Uncharacterized protein n=1 Tax=Zalaria obscura TaxID=2024903 RepID=A0ACC3SEX7_9PEZI